MPQFKANAVNVPMKCKDKIEWTLMSGKVEVYIRLLLRFCINLKRLSQLRAIWQVFLNNNYRNEMTIEWIKWTHNLKLCIGYLLDVAIVNTQYKLSFQIKQKKSLFKTVF